MPSPTHAPSARQQFWREHLRRCRAAGQTVAAYAAANGLAAHSLYKAQRQSRLTDSKPPRQLTTASASPATPRFVRVAMPAPAALPCRAHLRNGVVIEIGVGAADLAAVLRNLAQLP